jgi:hypothetical protein
VNCTDNFSKLKDYESILKGIAQLKSAYLMYCWQNKFDRGLWVIWPLISLVITFLGCCVIIGFFAKQYINRILIIVARRVGFFIVSVPLCTNSLKELGNVSVLSIGHNNDSEP